MTIEGDYALFAHLETVYLGALARRTLVMRNVRAVVEAARGKTILFMPARHDHWLVQTGDGWAAHVAGAIGVSTDANASWWGGRGVGTVPHGLIAPTTATPWRRPRAFAARYAGTMNVTVLVDFENDSVPDGGRGRRRARRRPLGRSPRHVRALVDRALEKKGGPQGVNPELVRLVRTALDDAGHQRVRIVASGGFDAEKIAEFEAEGVPVDAYGIGSSLVRGNMTSPPTS